VGVQAPWSHSLAVALADRRTGLADPFVLFFVVATNSLEKTLQF